jgi:hypothetical protein
MTRLLFLALALCSLWSCGSFTTSGTSTETTNGIAGVVRVDGAPLVAAKVTLIHANGAVSAFGSTSDSSGRFFIAADSGRYHLLVEAPDSTSMAWRYDVVTGQDTALEVGATPPGSWKINGLAAGDSVCLLVTPFCGAANAEGSALFSYLPEASFTAVRNGLPIASATIVPSDTVVTGATSGHGLVLEDFDDGDARHLLQPLSGGLGWHIFVPSHTLLNFPSDTLPFSLALVTENAWRGRSLLIRYQDTAFRPQVASMQVGLFLGDAGLDLSQLDSICFWVRGDSGLVDVAFEQIVAPGEYVKSVQTVSVESDWREKSIPISRFVDDPGYANHVSFATISSQVHQLTFSLSGGHEFSLDQIRLVGVVPAQFTLDR